MSRIQPCSIDALLRLGLAFVLTVTLSNDSACDSLLVLGFHSDNVVQFDLTTGEARVIAQLAEGARPRGVAVSCSTEIFLALVGGQKNVVKLVPRQPAVGSVPMVAVDVTPQIGRYGPGQLAFDEHGALVVTGDSERALLRYDVETGKLIESLTFGRKANVAGLVLGGQEVFVAEYFQRTVLRYDLAAVRPTGEVFIDRSEKLDRPLGLTIGHNRNLFVSSHNHSLIQEFDRETGRFLGTFVDVHTIGAGQVHNVLYSPGLRHFFIAAGDAVYQLSIEGKLVSTFCSDSLVNARALAVLPTDSPKM